MKAGNITKFYPKNAADNPDNVLEQAIGQYTDVLIFGYEKDGDFSPRGSLGITVGEMIVMIELFKRDLLDGVYDQD